MKYLPWIIGAIVILYLIKKFGTSKGVTLAPQTQITQTPQGDPFAVLRGEAFNVLGQLGIAQTQSEKEQAIAKIEQQTAQQLTSSQERIAGMNLQSRLRELDIAESLGLKSSETEIAKTSIQSDLAKYLQQSQISYNQFLQNAYLEGLQLNFAQREQDRQLQQAAIDRYYRERSRSQTGGIVGSIIQGIAGIFNPSPGSFRTPPTFPSFGGFDGGGSGGFFPEEFPSDDFSVPPFLA